MTFRRLTFIIFILCVILFDIAFALPINSGSIKTEQSIHILNKRQDSSNINDSTSVSSDTSSSTPTPSSAPSEPSAPSLPGTQIQVPIIGPTTASVLLGICAITILVGGIMRALARKEKNNVNILTEKNGSEEPEPIDLEPEKIPTQQYSYI